MRRLLGLAVVTAWMVMLGGTGWADMGKNAPALKAAAGSKAEAHVKEGIEHYDQGHFDVALKHFTAGIKEDAKSAEAHYDAALALDKLGDHKAATEHFKKATELGTGNPEIENSGILKAHLKK
ncbi:MAG TPA: tetratricopeptide repeat protein [Nitrospirales bacterium]